MGRSGVQRGRSALGPPNDHRDGARRFRIGNRVDVDLGYRLPVRSRLVGTPRLGFATLEYGRDYRLGYSLAGLGGEGTQFELGVAAQLVGS